LVDQDYSNNKKNTTIKGNSIEMWRSIDWHKTPGWVKSRLRHTHLDNGQTVTLRGRHFEYRIYVSCEQGHINFRYNVERRALYHHRGYRLGVSAVVIIVIVALVLGFWLARH